jgi:hypothetical protein
VIFKSAIKCRRHIFRKLNIKMCKTKSKCYRKNVDKNVFSTFFLSMALKVGYGLYLKINTDACLNKSHDKYLFGIVR